MCTVVRFGCSVSVSLGLVVAIQVGFVVAIVVAGVGTGAEAEARAGVLARSAWSVVVAAAETTGLHDVVVVGD
jgi:hypothetical protein